MRSLPFLCWLCFALKDTAVQTGHEASKKGSGIKRHIAVNTQGLPHAIAVAVASVTDRKGLPAQRHARVG